MVDTKFHVWLLEVNDAPVCANYDEQLSGVFLN